MVSRFQQHNQIAMQMLYASYKAGDMQLADKISKSLKKDMEQQVAYYQGLPDNKRGSLSSEEERNANLLRGLMELEQRYKSPQPIMPQENGQTLQTTPVKPADSNP